MRRLPSRLVGLVALLAAVGAALWGSGIASQYARTAYDAAGVQIERAGWDTLRAHPQFVRRTSLGGAPPARPTRTTVHVFGANYDTLYAGPAGEAIPIPDRRLDDREPLLVEACGTFRLGDSVGSSARTLCQQTSVRASPKRVHAEQVEVTFSRKGDFRKGRYDMRLRVERRAFGDTAQWEPLPAARPEGVLLARAESPGGQSAVRVPLDSSGRGAFDLARYDGYDDFSYHLRATMEQPGRPTVREEASAPSATVAFEVRAGPDGTSLRPVRRFQKTVRRLTLAEHRRRVQNFAQSASRAIARRLHEDRDDEGDWPDEWDETITRATVEDWRYERAGERYTAELRVRWYEEDDRDDRYRIDGTLVVQEKSRRARFTGKRGNRRTVERWRRVAESDTLALGTLAEPDTSARLPVVKRKSRLRDIAERRRSDRSREKEPRRDPWHSRDDHHDHER